MTITPTRYESIESITPNGNPIQIHGRNPFGRRATSCDGEMETAVLNFGFPFPILDFYLCLFVLFVCLFVFFLFFPTKVVVDK